MSPRLKLHLHDAQFQGDVLALQRPGSAVVLHLPGDKQSWLPLLDGSRDLQAFIGELLSRDSGLSFREILGTLRSLEMAGLLVEPLGLAQATLTEEPLVPPHPQRKGGPSAQLQEAFAGAGIFEGFPGEVLDFFAAQGELRPIQKDTFLVREGEEADEFYLLLEGSVSVFKRGSDGAQRRVCVLQGHTVFGEAALKARTRRGADIFVRQEGLVFVLSRRSFEACMERFPEHFGTSTFFERILVSQFLSTTPLFREIPAEALGVFSREGRILRFGNGQDVFRQGQEGDAFYLIVRGLMGVLRGGNSGPVLLKQGDCFGEVALFSGEPRNATVRSLEESAVLRLEAPVFWRILLENLGLALQLEEVAQRRGHGEALTLT